MKNKQLFFALAMLLVACGTDDSKGKEGTQQQYTIEQFMDNVRIAGGSIAHDNATILLSSNESGIYNLQSISADGKTKQKLTDSEQESIFAISYFPNDKRLLYRSDQGGNEINHIFLREENGTVRELTTDSTARAAFYGWSGDEKSFFFGYNQRDPKLMDIYEMSIDNFEAKLIYKNEAAYEFGGISNDKQYMALSKSINTNDADLFLYNFTTKQLDKISTEQASHAAADFSVDNRYLYYLTDTGSDFAYLMKYDLTTSKREKVQAEAWDISYAYFSKTGKYRVVGINEDGKTKIKIYDTKAAKIIDFPSFGEQTITSVNISNDEKLMSFFVGGSNTTSNLYSYDFATKKYKQLTNTLNPEINSNDLVAAEVLRFASFDGLEIPGIYYKPKFASANEKVPALIWVHGGPGGQSRQNYSPLLQYLVNHGYAVYAINNRGSSGYGKKFYQLDDKNHGEGDLKDCIAAKKYLAALPYIDEDRIGIIGGSYGGYMVMRALTAAPEEFDLGVNIFGVTNWLRTLKSIPPWWESFKAALYEEMGDPNQDSTRLYNISPLFHAANITKPVMVLQGAKDPRVLQVESDEMVAAIKKNNVPVDYVLFEDEGHGFRKNENQIEAWGKILVFLDRHLKGKKVGKD
ncbi:MAG: alpha/beta fold hydrolase [Saprospiraceae bacterium]